VNELAAVLHAFAMQNHVHGGGRGLFLSHCGDPGGAKRLGRLAPAPEARTMTRGQRHRLVEEKELGPAPAAHYLSPASLVLAATDQPCLARPALSQQGLRHGVMDDASVPCECSSLTNRDDVTERRDTVL
jgi:hypothetical protein